MSYLREYIRWCLFEEGTCAFGEYPLSYNPQSVLSECNQIRDGFSDLIGDNMELAYFSRSLMNEINGAAWIGDDKKVFEFAVVTDENTPDFVFENLVRNCMDEYIALKSDNPQLKLEVKAEDEETEKHLSEVYGLSVIKQASGMAIMGFES